MNKKFLSLLGTVLLSSSVLAAVLVIVFGVGTTNLIPFFFPAKVGVASPAQFYYATLDGWTATPANILAFDRFDANGLVDIVVNSNVGGCNWFGLIEETVPTTNSTHFALSNLDGLAVESGNNLYWAVKPTVASVQNCRLDYNVSVITQ